MSSGLRLASSEGQPSAGHADDPAVPGAAPVAAPATRVIEGVHLVRCAECGGLNGQSATQCWSCEAALTPVGPTPELLMPEGPGSAAQALIEPAADTAPAWADDPTVPIRPAAEPATRPTIDPALAATPGSPSANAPLLTHAVDDYATAVTHWREGHKTHRRNRVIIASAASVAAIAVLGTIVYFQWIEAALPALEVHSPVDPTPQPLSATPTFPTTALAALPGPARATAGAAATGPAPVGLARVASVAPAPPMGRVQAGKASPPKVRPPRVSEPPVATRSVQASPRREPCSPTIAALGLCAPPTP